MLDEISFRALDAFSPNLPRAASLSKERPVKLLSIAAAFLIATSAGAYMETWVDYSRQGFDALAASEILSQGVSNGLKGKVE